MLDHEVDQHMQDNSGRYKSRPHSKLEKRLQKKARRQRRKQACREKQFNSVVEKCKSETQKLLHEQAFDFKRKIAVERNSNLRLESLVDKCNKGARFSRSKGWKHSRSNHVTPPTFLHSKHRILLLAEWFERR